jgi:predicted HicB family RNase H-like nuclease
MSMTEAQLKATEKYNQRVYARYTFRVRKDAELYEDILKYTSRRGASLNGLVVKLLEEYFNRGLEG